MTDTLDTTETLASTTFIEENVIQQISINAFDLLNAHVARVLATDTTKELTTIERGDLQNAKSIKVPESLKTLNFKIFVLKNEMVAVGYSDLARVEEYDEQMGQWYALENAIDVSRGFMAGVIKEDRADKPLKDVAENIAKELCPTSILTMNEPCYRIFPMNLGHVLGSIMGVENINHALKDVAITLVVMESNGFSSFGYHQAPNHDAYDENTYRTMASMDAIMRIKNIRLMIEKNKQMKENEA